MCRGEEDLVHIQEMERIRNRRDKDKTGDAVIRTAKSSACPRGAAESGIV